MGNGDRGITETIDQPEDGHVEPQGLGQKNRPQRMHHVRSEIVQVRHQRERPDGFLGLGFEKGKLHLVILDGIGELPRLYDDVFSPMILLLG